MRLLVLRLSNGRISLLLSRFLCVVITKLKWTVLRPGYEDRLGHQVLEPMYFELQNQYGSLRSRRILVLWDPAKVANSFAYGLLPKRYLRVKNRFLRNFLVLGLREQCKHEAETALSAVGSDQAARVFQLAHHVSHGFDFYVVPNEIAVRRALWKRLGVPDDRWLCCLHVREPGAFQRDEYHDYRNGSPDNLEPAIADIFEAGGYTVRLGSPAFSEMGPRAGFLDFAHHALRSEKNDFLLTRSARFFLGNTSGAAAPALAQGIPLAAVNVAPLGALKVWGPRDIAIPKLYRIAGTDELLPFGSLLQSEWGNLRSSKGIAVAGLEVVENDAGEIRDLVREMIDVLDEKKLYSPDEELLQARMQGLFVPRNYTYHSRTRIGSKFLQKYEDLIRV
jgi:putative glycosyltransferase (TIGR04372 family)